MPSVFLPVSSTPVRVGQSVPRKISHRRRFINPGLYRLLDEREADRRDRLHSPLVTPDLFRGDKRTRMGGRLGTRISVHWRIPRRRSLCRPVSPTVMPGLVPGIHALRQRGAGRARARRRRDVDARNKSGHDGRGVVDLPVVDRSLLAPKQIVDGRPSPTMTEGGRRAIRARSPAPARARRPPSRAPRRRARSRRSAGRARHSPTAAAPPQPPPRRARGSRP